MEVMETVEAEKEVRPQKNIEEVYERTFPGVAAFVSRMGGSFEDAKDVFHDALIVYFELTSNQLSAVYRSEEAYILGIAKHLWTRKYHRMTLFSSLSDKENSISVPDDFFPTVQHKRLLRFLESAGRKCMDLLHAFYYGNKPVKELASELGFRNEHSFSAQKYKCLGKIRNTIKEKTLSYEDFME